MFEIDTEGKILNPEKLEAFGFERDSEGFVYTCDIPEIQMAATIRFCDGKLYMKLTDSFGGDEYVLHGVPSATGAFVGKVRECTGRLLDNIIGKCYNKDAFEEFQSKKIIEYVSAKYGDELEYLWEDTPDNAIWRRQDNKKWYAALLTVSRSKLGLQGDKKAEIINLKASPERVTELLKLQGIFPAYHMNKKHWYTVMLDGTLKTEFVCSLIDKSFECLKNKKTKRREHK